MINSEEVPKLPSRLREISELPDIAARRMVPVSKHPEGVALCSTWVLHCTPKRSHFTSLGL